MSLSVVKAASPLVELLFEEVAAGRCLVAPDGRVLRVNAEWLRATGLSREEVVGADVVELLSEPRDMSRALHARARAGHHVEVPPHAQAVEGRETWWEGAIDPIEMDGGTGLLLTQQEVGGERPRPRASEASQEALRESERKLRQLAFAMPQIVCVLRPDGSAEYLNARWTEYSGLDLAGTNALGWQGVLHPDDFPAAGACRLRVLKQLSPQEVELRYRRADGCFRWFLSRLAPVVEDGRVVRLVGAAMDIDDHKRAEQVLGEQLALKDQLAKVAAAVPGVVCSFRLRPDGTVSMPFSAPAIVDLYGVAQEELARDLTAIRTRTLPEDLARMKEEAAASARTLSPWRVSFHYQHPDKGPRWIEGTAIPTREEDGSTLWHGYVADVTEQRRAEDALRRSEREFRHLADAMPQLVWANRPDGSAEYYNRQWRDYTGIPLDRERDPWGSALHPDDRARALESWRRSLASGEPHEIEFRLRSARDGAFRWFLVRALPMRDGDGSIYRWFGTCTDIHEQKRVEDELLAAKREAAESAARLREEHRRKDEFLGMLSHELRNPLAPIRTSLYVLRHAPARDPDHALLVIERQVEHLTRLVDDLLDVTRIARGKIQLRRERLDLVEVVRQTGEDLRSRLDERGVAFRISVPREPVQVDADGTRLAQVIGNLLQNAAKFTRQGDEVTLCLEVLRARARIRVADTGAGIDPLLLETVFDPFVQADRTLARTEGGLGLGLALVKGIVELHGGSVQADSAGPGRGTVFTVDLPVSPAAPASQG